MKQQQDRKFFTPSGASEYLDGIVTEATIRYWMVTRKIAFIKIGGRVAIPKAELDRLIQAGTVLAEAR